ncbi:hypothetical protein [Flavobacterium seoulense]|uniref:DUF4142 domain-containing protein n=1 Tax=Flavobacterium seoulense TaxID=1492738 RepID=A0A066WQF5_9FLAO|nr:hypothetical protein [Flavobacterium seoulense]KDN56071.1 hypothetical protein FEM21_06230 [Flavobacterium seoulense]
MTTSCEKKIKEIEETSETKVLKKVITKNKISEETLTLMAETNLKIVAIAQKAQESKIPKRTKHILEEIEKDHAQLKNEIRKIAKDNFVIIPNTLYDTSTIKDFIQEINISLYLKKLETSLLTELNFYQKLNVSTKNKNLKNLIKATIPMIEKNLNIIKKEQKRL